MWNVYVVFCCRTFLPSFGENSIKNRQMVRQDKSCFGIFLFDEIQLESLILNIEHLLFS